jgi:ABC-type transporter Mla subunit MlaD
MNERQMQFRVGVVVFATMIIGGLLATLNAPLPTGWLPWGRTSYRVGIRLNEAPGVAPNTPVRRNGILIGRVSRIEDLQDAIVVWANIDGDRPLYPQYEPQVRTTVLGDASIDFSTRPLPPGTQPVEDGTVFQGRVAPNPFDAIAKLGDLQDDIERTMDALTRAGDEVAELAQRVNTAFGDETEEGRVSRLLDTTERAMEQFAQTMSAFNDIFGDGLTTVVPREPAGRQQPQQQQRQQTPRQQLNRWQSPLGQQFVARPASMQQPLDDPQPIGLQQQPEIQPPLDAPPPLEPQAPEPGAMVQEPIDGALLRQRIRQGLYELPDAVREAHIAMSELRVVLASAERNFQNLEGFTEPLGQRGEQIADSLIRATEGMDRMFEDFSQLSEALNNREGTLGRLLHDPQAYDNLNRLMCNANQVLAQINDLAIRLRPVVNDARIFMDKVAREPGRVVTGGLNPSPIK